MPNTSRWAAEIDAVRSQLIAHYVVPEVGARVAGVLATRLSAGAYADLDDESAFADAVTVDMQSVNGDPHLFLSFSELIIPENEEEEVDGGALRAEAARLTGSGFTRVDRLPGNVGLLDIRKFYAPQVAGSGDAAVAAMHLVAGADALIIDLRENTGGEPDMVALVSGFLFDERTHLLDLVFPGENRTVQYWTAPHIPPPIFGGGKPVWVLIGPRTFSAGEGISYQLQQCGRAVLVGEPTVAAPATFHYPYRVGPHLLSAVPSGYPRDPVSGTNWAGLGVLPDVRVPAAGAFDEAYRAALHHVLGLGEAGARRRIAEEGRAALDGLR